MTSGRGVGLRGCSDLLAAPRCLGDLEGTRRWVSGPWEGFSDPRPQATTNRTTDGPAAASDLPFRMRRIGGRAEDGFRAAVLPISPAEALPSGTCGSWWDGLARRLAAFERAALESASDGGGGPDRRLRIVLEECDRLLGPTQREHLTEHSVMVSRLSVRLGAALRLGDADLRRLGVAGLCHDLGKFLIPEAILARRGPLTEVERRLVSRHPEFSALMCARLGADGWTVRCVRYHHAWYDGRNSDRRRDAIPVGARILAIADAFVTITSGRPYRRARPRAAALRELRRGCGRQFDPRAVDAFTAALSGDD